VHFGAAAIFDLLLWKWCGKGEGTWVDCQSMEVLLLLS
jgi:hypothetical protein